MKIAISGPAASGKGTIARRLAVEMGIGYVDLGLLFRLGAFALSTRRVSQTGKLFELIKRGVVTYMWVDGRASIFWESENVTPALLGQEIAHQTSVLASDREELEMLTKIANCVLETFTDVVCDGRNAGTTILPDANYKFFVTARLEERARRRYLDVIQRGDNTTYEMVLCEIEERDRRDAERVFHPSIVPEAAMVLETDAQSVEESTQFVLEKIKPTS